MSKISTMEHARELFEPRVGSDMTWYVNGPCHVMSFHGATLWPWSRFSSEAAASGAARLCQEAYLKGVDDAKREMRLAMGVKE